MSPEANRYNPQPIKLDNFIDNIGDYNRFLLFTKTTKYNSIQENIGMKPYLREVVRELITWISKFGKSPTILFCDLTTDERNVLNQISTEKGHDYVDQYVTSLIREQLKNKR